MTSCIGLPGVRQHGTEHGEDVTKKGLCCTYAVVQLQEQFDQASTRMAVSFMLC